LQAKIFHYGSTSLIDEPCKSAHLAALRIAKDSDCILSYDPKLRLALWPSAEAARNGIMSIWHLADVIKVNFICLVFYFYTIHFINVIARHSFSFLSLFEVLFSYVLQISEDEITFLIDRCDHYDDDVVLDKLFYPNLKLLIVTGGSEGCRYYTKVSLPKSFNSDFNCLNRFYNPSFHYFLCSLF